MPELSKSDLVDVVGFCDPAGGRTTITNAQSAIVIVGQGPGGQAFALAEWADRVPSDVVTAHIFTMNRQWGCKRFGIDATGPQYLYFQDVVREANARRERIAILPREFSPSEGSKEFRITTTIQRWMHNGLLYVGNCPQLRKQLENYPTGRLCDLVDALAAALGMLRDPLASKAGLTVEGDDEERWGARIRESRRFDRPMGR